MCVKNAGKQTTFPKTPPKHHFQLAKSVYREKCMGILSFLRI